LLLTVAVFAATGYVSSETQQQAPTELCTSGEYLPHECNCKLKSLYYECVDGKYVERQCPDGKIFDSNSSRCVTAVYCPPTGYKLIADEANCSLYYECRDGVKTEKTCKNGLSFDEKTHMCSWPPSSECSFKRTNLFDAMESSDDYKCPASGNTRLPHECSCTKYYACENGHRFVEDCPNGMIYDYIRHICDYSYNAVCKHRKNNDNLSGDCVISNDCSVGSTKRFRHKYCRLYYQCYSRLKCLRSCLEGHVFNPIIESCDRPENYPECVDYEDFTTPKDQDCQSCACTNCIPRYPDNTNCSRYFECESNIKVSRVCPPNLVYDPNRQICDYPQNVNCSPPPRCNEGELTHHECQCNLYYECVNGRKKIVTCPDGKYFDWETKKCRPPEEVRCYPQGCIGICPSNETKKLPHDDCHKYCECTKGSNKVVTCDNKQIYDPEQQKCIPPEDSKKTCEFFPCDPNSNSTSLIPHQCLCDRYYECKKGHKYLVLCPDGKHFDYVQERCIDSKDGAHCYKREPCSSDPDCGDVKCTTDGSTSPHKDCTKYCVCRNGYGVTESCSPGLYFDKVSGKCAWPENVDLAKNCQPFNCTDNPIPHDCNCTFYYQCEKGDRYLETCDGTYFDYVLGKCVNIANDPHCYHHYSNNREVDNCVEQCSKHSSVRMRHKKCSQYCVCSMGAPYIVRCPDGKEYNERTQNCTSRETANCQPWQENENKPPLSNFPFVDYL
ncbi:unnamed protein product, partial [Heterotrigona itama]